MGEIHNAIHWVFGALHNWLFVAFVVVLLTLLLTMIIFRRRKYFGTDLPRVLPADPRQELRNTPPNPKG
jgi:Flp pilus assembly protein TadB